MFQEYSQIGQDFIKRKKSVCYRNEEMKGQGKEALWSFKLAE